MPLQLIYKTQFQRLSLLFTKYHMFKRNDMHMTLDKNLNYFLPFNYSCASFSWPSFLLTRYLRIDKNYTLSIFMLSGSIRFYSQI